MILGLLSDTHDRDDAMAQAVQMLRDGGAEFYIHCGDVGSERVLDHLAGLPAAFIWGNNDWDREPLERYARQLGIACYGVFADLELGGKRAAVIHGDDLKLKQRLIRGQAHDYLFQGHTHVPDDERIGRTRIINPGALHRARPRTVAMLDTTSDDLRFLTLDAVP